jgi:SAM-dependent methyltransferase
MSVATLKLRDRLYAWWWWRSPNRPHIIDRTYLVLLDQMPADARGLDLGSRSRIREHAITLDMVAVPGVDIVGDAHQLPFDDDSFDYVWCNAVLEHVPYPMQVASEIGRILKPEGLAFIQVPFLENVHGWPDDYYRFTLQGLRVLFKDIEEVASGVSAGPGQVLPDLVQYYCTAFAELQRGGLLINLCCLLPGVLLIPFRLLDHALRGRPSYWKWARGYYWVGRKPLSQTAAGGGSFFGATSP